jgi:hypothetical protein
MTAKVDCEVKVSKEMVKSRVGKVEVQEEKPHHKLTM